MQNSSSHYYFSSLVPKVKKSIKKYKKNYNKQFLNQIWLQKREEEVSPPKFLQPIKYYRFYGDLAMVDNPENFGDYISQINIQMNYKTISKIDINETITIHLEDKFSLDYCSIGMFVERLNSLGNTEAHELANMFLINKEKLSISDTKPSDSNYNQNSFIYKANPCRQEDLFASNEELIEYNEMKAFYKQEFKKYENSLSWILKISFIKQEPYIRYGPVINQMEFNKKMISFFLNKNMEDLTYDDAIDISNFSSIPHLEYFQFFIKICWGYFANHYYDSYECDSILRTYENYSVPCREIAKTFIFKGEKYEEINYVIAFKIEEKYIHNVSERRNNEKLKESYKNDLDKAKLYVKYRKIEKITSDSWKTLCLFYYGNNEINDDDGDENNKNRFERQTYWNNLDQSKICKYRYIDKSIK